MQWSERSSPTSPESDRAHPLYLEIGSRETQRCRCLTLVMLKLEHLVSRSSLKLSSESGQAVSGYYGHKAKSRL